jgi:nondiscriminating aspartyl-tRNA synthetase
MKRTLISDTPKHLGETIRVSGWLNSRRDHGGIIFFDLRDNSEILQIVCPQNLAEGIKEEYVLSIEGEVKKRPANMVNPNLATGEVELKASKIEILAKSETPPFDLKDMKVTLPTLLDHRPFTLRNQRIKAIFKVQQEIVDSFRNTLKKSDFTEFQAPAIVPANAEGGAEVFRIDYYDYDAYLAQSPQLYKQIMVGVFERVFTINKVFRAEPSVTTRHLSEYVSLDLEMGFIDSWQDLMDVCELIIKNIFSDLKNNCKKDLEVLGTVIPQVSEKIPRLKMREAQEIIFERTKRDNRKEPDLEPEDEKEICEFAKEKYGSELIFITHYPTKKRPFYTYADPEDENYTLSFDLLCRGSEVVTGGQRINDYEKVIQNIKKWGNKPEDFSYYLQAFKYGMPPEGGFAIGMERLTKQILDLENIREASVFPRDMERIDLRLSVIHKNEKDKKLGRKKVKK